MANNKQNIRKEMGSRVRVLRKARGLSIDTLSVKLGLTPGHLGLIERGDRGITVDRLMQVCTYFGCTADFLLTGKDKATSKGKATASVDLMLSDDEREKLAELINLLRG
ncbi:MAG: helix-turn-helix domain-containing protein [Defluviitaleaceae bacterium]|nr:helix-turn-helix domain-containing protein [Defluviitaleaceae bacterium]